MVDQYHIFSYYQHPENQRFLITFDNEKVLKSVNYMFLISVMKKFGLRKEIIRWIQTLLKCQNP